MAVGTVEKTIATSALAWLWRKVFRRKVKKDERAGDEGLWGVRLTGLACLDRLGDGMEENAELCHGLS